MTMVAMDHPVMEVVTIQVMAAMEVVTTRDMAVVIMTKEVMEEGMEAGQVVTVDMERVQDMEAAMEEDMVVVEVDITGVMEDMVTARTAVNSMAVVVMVNREVVISQDMVDTRVRDRSTNAKLFFRIQSINAVILPLIFHVILFHKVA